MDVAFERNSSAAAAVDVAAVQQQQQHVWTGTCCQLWVHQAFVLSVLQSLAAVRPDRLRKRVFTDLCWTIITESCWHVSLPRHF